MKSNPIRFSLFTFFPYYGYPNSPLLLCSFFTNRNLLPLLQVSSGKDHYSEGPYSIFAGRDSSVCFATGVFTEEEAEKSAASLTPAQINSLERWRTFYAEGKKKKKKNKYPFKGYLVHPRWYDNEGNPTEELMEVRTKLREHQQSGRDDL